MARQTKRIRKIDRAQTNSIVIPNTKKNRRRFDPRRVDFQGKDTKTGTKGRALKVRKGRRGGFYVIKNGQRRYLKQK